VKGLFGSYRWRRRFLWFSVVAVVAGASVGIAMLWPNTAPPEPKTTNHRAYIPPAPKNVTPKKHQETLALGVASRFIDTAVTRENVDAAWSLVAPEFKSGFTRSEWDKGDIPVQPYPAGPQRRWALDYSDTQGIGFQIALFPKKGVKTEPFVFLIGLHQIRGHWVVDNWQPAPANTVAPSNPGPTTGVIEKVTPHVTPSSTKPKEGQIWLLLPVGALSLIIVIPLLVMGLNWYRGHKAEADFNATRPSGEA
jgi:hypothetical protein